MKTSTPLQDHSRNQKRRSKYTATDQETPSKRTNVSSIMELDETEENQRSARRDSVRMAELQLNYKKEEIMPQLEICMNLYAANKLDNKNVWAVKIIDILSMIARENTFDSDTLKIATSSLEASAKVFGIRVDCVHAQTLQLASNIIHNFDEAAQQKQQDSNNLEDQDSAVETEKKKKKNEGKQVKTLMGDDPYPSTCHDLANTFPPIKLLPSCEFQLNHQGYLNQYLPQDPSLKYKFMSDCPYFRSEDDLQEYNKGWDNVQVLFNKVEIKFYDICSEFSHFNWDDKLEPNDPMNVTDIVMDNDGLPIPELDGSILDPFAEAEACWHNDVVEEEEMVHAEIGMPNVQYISETVPSLIHVDEVSVEDMKQISSGLCPMLKNLWAGPSHWKLKWIKQAKNVFTGTMVQKEKKARTKKRVVDELCFTNEAIIRQHDEEHIMRKKIKRHKMHYRNSYRIPRKVVEEELKPMECFRNRYINLVSAPDDNDGDSPREYAEEEVDAAEYNYDNPNDSQYCIQADIFDDGVTDEIDMPDIIPKSTIGYARTSKKMNMRKLKCAIWDNLSGSSTLKTNDIEKSNTKIVGVKHFKDIYNELSEQLPSAMAEALSAPLAFAGLLHLANEKKLQIRGVESMNDMLISQLIE